MANNQSLNIPASIEAGVQFLDNHFGKDWVDAIDLDQFDIIEPFHCVLGQLDRKGIIPGETPGFSSRGYYSARRKLDLTDVQCAAFGFEKGYFDLDTTWDELAEAWETYLDARKAASQDNASSLALKG